MKVSNIGVMFLSVMTFYCHTEKLGLKEPFYFRCICLLAELSQLPDAAADVAKELPLVVNAASFKHYTQHVHLLETMCKQVNRL